MKREKKKQVPFATLALLPAVSLLLLVGAVNPASSLSAGEQAYVNISGYCNEGATQASAAGNTSYQYKMLDGDTTKLRMMYLSDTNEDGAAAKTDESGASIWVYCVEYGTPIESYNRRTATGLAESAVWQNLGETQKRGILLATLYGCPVSDLGASTADAYAATQALIWEFQTGIRKTLSAEGKEEASYRGGVLEKTRFTAMLEGKAGMGAYQTLVQKVAQHETVPSFSGREVLLDYHPESGTYRSVLSDENSVLAEYRIQTAGQALTLTPEGNTLVLESETPVMQEEITLQRILPELTSQALLALAPTGTGQTTLIGQQSAEVFSAFSVRTATGTLRIRKTASDGRVEGITFSINGQGGTHTLSTDETGLILLQDLPTGKYVIKEELPGEQYVPVPEQTVLLKRDTETEVTFHNREKTGTVILQKKDQESEEGLPDVEFTLYRVSATTEAQSAEKVGSYKTGENGEIRIEGLPYGDYFFLETKALSGYLPTEEKLPFSITEEGQEVLLNAKNQKAPAEKEPEAPKGKGQVPKTGDETTLLLPFLGMGIGLSGVLFFRHARRKKGQNDLG